MARGKVEVLQSTTSKSSGAIEELITFSQQNSSGRSINPERALYVTAFVGKSCLKRALMDTGVYINVILASTLKTMGVPKEKIVPRPITIYGINAQQQDTLGYVNLEVKVGSIKSRASFHVLDGAASYHVILGRAWLHTHKAVASTYHQCVKVTWKGKEVTIPATSTPFDESEAYFFETAQCEDLAPFGENSIKAMKATSLPKWE
jgi:hypothetical protein